MSNEKMSRRQFVQTAATGVVSVTALGLLITGCEKQGADSAAPEGTAPAETAEKALDCTDTTGLTETEIATRKSLAYVDQSPIPEKLCSNCQLFVPAKGDGCGSCTVVKGPIHPAGYCNSWVQKQG